MTNPSQLDARYGRKHPSASRRRWAVIVPAAAAIILVTLWYFWANPNKFGQLVSGEETAHQVIDERHMSVTISVTAEAGRSVACAIKAQDLGFNVVGWKVFEYPASTQPTRSFTEQVRTTRKAVTGLVADCWLT
jgi:hypothetical protein